MNDDIYRIGDQQRREMQESGRKICEAAVEERIRQWGIGREPAEYIFDLERKLAELKRESDR